MGWVQSHVDSTTRTAFFWCLGTGFDARESNRRPVSPKHKKKQFARSSLITSFDRMSDFFDPPALPYFQTG